MECVLDRLLCVTGTSHGHEAVSGTASYPEILKGLWPQNDCSPPSTQVPKAPPQWLLSPVQSRKGCGSWSSGSTLLLSPWNFCYLQKCLLGTSYLSICCLPRGTCAQLGSCFRAGEPTEREDSLRFTAGRRIRPPSSLAY